jgi:hypothetical protein
MTMRIRFRDGPHQWQQQPTHTPVNADRDAGIADTRKAVADVHAPMASRIKALNEVYRKHYGD